MSGFTTLQDFDYSVNVSVSSDRVGSMRTPHVLLMLSLSQPDGSVKDEVLELSKPELERLLAEMNEIEARTIELGAKGTEKGESGK